MRLGRRVALKVLRAEFAGNPVRSQRFFAEARAVNRISHENIVEVSDFVEKPGGPSFYIMELLNGEDLAASGEREGDPADRAHRHRLQICERRSAPRTPPASFTAISSPTTSS